MREWNPRKLHDPTSSRTSLKVAICGLVPPASVTPDYLTPAEMATLKRAFQQRNLLAHTQGIVDQNYIDRSGDSSLEVGERLVIDEDAVLRFLEGS